MNAVEKHKAIFGEIKSLAEPISWATGVSNMLEWLVWETQYVLGITKTQYLKRIVKLSHREASSGKSLEETLKAIKRNDELEKAENECSGRYDKPKDSLASAREAMRRTKYFSESYLNKEFDIFWTLVSDHYLDQFYGLFTKLNGGGQWFTHGNSILFNYSAEISDMQMDNLSYNPDEKLLVANELKLGSSKNKDQILKYGLLFSNLKKRNFILPDTRLLLLFIGAKADSHDWAELIESEISHCQKSSKSTALKAIDPENIEIVRQSEIEHTTWPRLIEFNTDYMSKLSLPAQQVEFKLLCGFNETLKQKAVLQNITISMSNNLNHC